jgi:deoxyribonuclease-4
MRRLGVHTSIGGGLPLSLERAKALGCNTLQIFSHNPRSWAVKQISEDDVSEFRSLRLNLDISPVFVHASYLLNVASRDILLRRKSVDLLIVEMTRADTIGADYVILHTGSASGEDAGIARKRAIDALNEVSLSGTWKAGLLLENTAGERGDISSRVGHLGEMADGVEGTLIRGICLDTCHAYAAGYDIRGETETRALSREIERHFGPDRIKLIHLNDSKGSAGSRIDRHEHIGLGKIGADGLCRFINHKPFRNIPLILETPKKLETDDPENLEKVRKMIRTKR